MVKFFKEIINVRFRNVWRSDSCFYITPCFIVGNDLGLFFTVGFLCWELIIEKRVTYL